MSLCVGPLLAGLDATSGDAKCNSRTMAGLGATSMIAGLVGVELVWSTSTATCLAADQRNAVEQL